MGRFYSDISAGGLVTQTMQYNVVKFSLLHIIYCVSLYYTVLQVFSVELYGWRVMM